MSTRKSISNTFTVTTLVDGESAPYYFEEKYAWSNDSSTKSVTTPPSISGGWQTSIPPSNGYAYLWRMSIRHVWNESTRSYTQEAAQYFRMSGTNGTSIHIKGHVPTVQNLPTTHLDGDAYVVDANGHLYMWSDESGSWVDIGVFQGEAGKTYYTHIAWASQVNYSGTTVTSVNGFITDKSPNDTTHMWMGVYIDEQSGQDESNALRYTWSYTKGVDGISVQAQYAPNNNPSSSQIHNTWQKGDIYMRTKQSNETNWSSWHKIVGESGGETDYSFNISKEKTSASATTVPSNCYYSTWQDAPISPTSTYPYLWMKIQKKDGNGNNVGNASYARVTGEKGDNAQYIYIRGTGYNNDGERILNITSTTNVFSEYGSRGLVVARINRSTLAVSGITWFDVYGGISEGGESAANTNTARTRFVTYLANTTSDYFLAVASKDAIGFNDAMVTKLREFGLGELDYTAVSGVDGFRTPFAFLGYKGLQQGYALYQLQGEGENDPYAEVMAYVANGIFMSSKDGADGIDGTNGDDGVSYSIVFTKAAARVNEYNRVTAELAGYAYKDVGGVRSALKNTIIRYGYILTDYNTYSETTTDNSGFFDAGTWFNGDDITDYGKNSPSIFAAIIIDGTVVHAEMITISIKGSTGNRGKIGRFFYYAGELNDFASTDSFLVNDAQAPYFHYNNNYWVFNPETNGTYTKQEMGTPSSSSSNWKVMTSDFKYIITEAIFGSYAHFGSAIINGDWLLSTNGTINSVAYNNGSNYTYNGVTKPAYTWFDASNPNTNTGHNFIPNYAVDLLTGKSYQNEAYIKGQIVATSGSIDSISATNLNIKSGSVTGDVTIGSLGVNIKLKPMGSGTGVGASIVAYDGSETPFSLLFDRFTYDGVYHPHAKLKLESTAPYNSKCGNIEITDTESKRTLYYGSSLIPDYTYTLYEGFESITNFTGFVSKLSLNNAFHLRIGITHTGVACIIADAMPTASDVPNIPTGCFYRDGNTIKIKT